MTVQGFFREQAATTEQSCLVGTKLVLNNGQELLIGDVNTMGGICDDCTWWHAFGDEEIEKIVRSPAALAEPSGTVPMEGKP